MSLFSSNFYDFLLRITLRGEEGLQVYFQFIFSSCISQRIFLYQGITTVSILSLFLLSRQENLYKDKNPSCIMTIEVEGQSQQLPQIDSPTALIPGSSTTIKDIPKLLTSNENSFQIKTKRKKRVVSKQHHVTVNQENKTTNNPGNTNTDNNLKDNDKSFMSVLHGLAQYNNISQEYKTTEQSGPPHDKIFKVVLRLGDREEFEGSGPSIRKAQHAAAAAALQGTSFPHPPNKKNGNNKNRNASSTPTVALNVLAMKMGETVSYQVVEPVTLFPPGMQYLDFNIMYNFRGSNPNQRYHFPKTPYTATVTVAGQSFSGTGQSPQGAKHSAAEKALYHFQQQQRPDSMKMCPEGKPIPTALVSEESDKKSPVTVLHEIAMKLSWKVTFDVIDSSGPDHLPCFKTRCSVSAGHSVEAEGTNKRLSKKKAAEKMLEYLNTLPQYQDKLQELNKESQQEKRSNETDNSSRSADELDKIRSEREVKRIDSRDSECSLFSTCSSSTSEDDGKKSPTEEHPVSHLQTFVLSRISREIPKYRIIFERKSDIGKKEYVVECSVRDFRKGDKHGVLRTAVGIDLNKKDAKKKSAEAMMSLLTTGKTSDSVSLPEKSSLAPILKKEEQTASPRKRRERKVSFSDGGSRRKRGNSRDDSRSNERKGSKQSVPPGVIVVKTESKAAESG